MFIALRRFTLLTTMLLERIMYKRRHDRSTYGAVSIMILGAWLLRDRSPVVSHNGAQSERRKQGCSTHSAVSIANAFDLECGLKLH